ncbi:hypothetical protein C7444_1118 [Sphaerotilus hippei]|uniref:Uncharacterized protein n=1 Tax=Sphaerotilus hippei TaxID=744406 RepID=A0A318H6A2_9BURK|nr:hypothetical protein [Sphaerotilus hippei]PXW94926.1 hypothetical protein C7444_1118 [Sphaerotilus hippei]
MNFDKLDSALAAEVMRLPAHGAATVTVLVLVMASDPPTAAQQALLEPLGLPPGSATGRVFSATLTRPSLATLADLPWVLRLELARPMQGGGVAG